ncbi:MAG: hypothetical protein K6F71_04990 [Ruminococcus sp.]|uniref:hypothetical protein n=1 Tax=Ruminococcus sp. TaxID=41978 RepID=UPI0025EB214B|nr:hypothetical protein [Ruminococcus sp.]MCR5540166.1 hypothetical protein [Ruminococcus sp.]
MRKIEYVVSEERLITPSGLSLVGQVLGKSNLNKNANRMRTEKRSQPQIKNGDILPTMIGLLALGKSDFENVNEFHKDEEFYKIALGIAYGIPSEPRDISAMHNSVRESSIVRAARRNFSPKPSQQRSR